MGKAARIACIFTPMALTIASFICLILNEASGWNTGTLTDLYFFQANLTNLTIPADPSNSVLTTSISDAKDSLSKIYQVHLWNYCTSNSTDGSTVSFCSPRKSEFVFDPLDVWGFDITNGTNATSTSTSSSDNAIQSAVANAQKNADQFEKELLGEGGKDALDAYRTAAKWMFIAYQVSFWTTLATIVVGILAVFSRWGSFLTWIFAGLSSAFTLGAVLTSTILFSILVSALNKALEDYGIVLELGDHALVVTWLGVAFSWAATLFWLFSVCCCSGKSNPHHRGNKGGLWNAEAKGQGYRGSYPRGGLVQVEKGDGYHRVPSPYLGHHEDQVPLQDYAQPAAGYSHHHAQQQLSGFEPYRHN